MSVADDVAAFHEACGFKRLPAPGFPDHDTRALWVKLLLEELQELFAADQADDIVEVADALADITYIAVGMARVHGIDFDAVWGAVHASNMAKIGPDGKVTKRVDGKVVKGPHYRPPDIAKVLGMKTATRPWHDTSDGGPWDPDAEGDE